MAGKSARVDFGSTMRIWGVSSAGRASALQAEGHRFDPGTLHRGFLPRSARTAGGMVWTVSASPTINGRTRARPARRPGSREAPLSPNR
jgi:hypothetical protein